MSDLAMRTAYEILHVRDDAAQVVVDAAYRALARLHHPDRSPSAASSQRMAELNRAYAAVRTRELREVYDGLRRPLVPRADAPPAKVAPRAQAPRPDVLDFGRYTGWSLGDLARHDPDYLRWLSRHTSGIRHRRRIIDLLDEQTRKTVTRPLRAGSKTA